MKKTYADMIVGNLKELYKAYKAAEAEFEQIDAAAERDWMNERLQALSDDYYREVYHPAYMALVMEVVNVCGKFGQVLTLKQAKAMVASEKFTALMGRVM